MTVLHIVWMFWKYCSMKSRWQPFVNQDTWAGRVLPACQDINKFRWQHCTVLHSIAQYCTVLQSELKVLQHLSWESATSLPRHKQPLMWFLPQYQLPIFIHRNCDFPPQKLWFSKPTKPTALTTQHLISETCNTCYQKRFNTTSH